LDDVVAVAGPDRRADLHRLQAERYLLEFRNHGPAHERAEVAAASSAGVVGKLARDLVEGPPLDDQVAKAVRAQPRTAELERVGLEGEQDVRQGQRLGRFPDW